MAPLKTALLVAVSLTLVAGQRPSFAGSRPIGFPEVIKPTTDSQLGNRFGEDETTTVKLPLEANGDRDLVDRLSKLPVDQQPFWLINWQALDAHRKNPQTFEQKPNVFVDPANSQSQNIQPQQTNTQQQMTQQQMLNQQLIQQQQQMMQQQVQQQQQMALENQRRQQFEQQQQQFMQQQQMNAQVGNSNLKPVISGFQPIVMKPMTTLNRSGERISLHDYHRGNSPRTPTLEN